MLVLTRIYLRPGDLMTEAQSLFDEAAGPCCPNQLASPVLHKVLQYEPVAEHIWGGKGVGSQVPSQTTLTPMKQTWQHWVPSLLQFFPHNVQVMLQGDGAAQLLCRSQAGQAAVCRVLTDALHLHCMPLTLQPTADASAAIG